MSYRVTVTARFEAAHNLIDYEGGPEPLHGHSYRVEAVLESEKLQQHDLAVDFVPAQ
jgi:6-pyruvoyltetrahydropterin/6-carboxytetrahydropterin synthase